MAFPDTQDIYFFFSTASPEWLRTGPEGMSGDSRHFANPPELPWYTLLTGLSFCCCSSTWSFRGCWPVKARPWSTCCLSYGGRWTPSTPPRP